MQKFLSGTRSMGRYVSRLLLLFVSMTLCAAGAFAGKTHPMRFDHITLDDGLSQSNVLSVLQDSDGLMWFGTENGLNRYDGYEFEHFKRERGNPSALGSDFIFDVAQDSKGNLWVATNGGGVAMLDRATGMFTSYRHDPADPNSVASNIIRRVFVDAEGSVWIGTRGAGLDRLDPLDNRFTHYPLSKSDGQPASIFAIEQDSAGALWVGGDQGLTRLNTKTGATFTYSHDPADAKSLSEHGVRAIAEDADGRLWAGTYGGGLHRLTLNGAGFDHFRHVADDPATLAGDRVTSIFQDSDGRLWVGTTQGLNLVDRASGAVVRYVHDSADATSLGDNDITTIFEDRSGLLWIGTKTRGINKWNPRTWSYGLEPAKELTANEARQPNVTSFVEDATGTLWVGTFGDGLNAMDRASGRIVKYRNDPASAHRVNDDRIMSLMRDRDGMLWLGTMNSGVTRLNPETGATTTFLHDVDDPNSLSANGIMTVYEDRSGQVWIGTFGGGISRFDPTTERFTRFAAEPSNPKALSNNRVTSFAEDANGRMWIGTDAGGLNLFDPKTNHFHHFRHDPNDPSTLAADSIYSINVAADGTVWVGTRGGGLDRIVGDAGKPGEITFANVSQKDGLANDVIYGVLFDDAGWIWLSTNYGISRFNPKTGEIKNLHRKDGLQSEEFNFGAHYRSATGELFFGGHNGFNAFHPEKIRTNTLAPQIALTDYFNMNDPVKADLPIDLDEGVDISWNDGVVAFEFAALDFAAPEKNQYMYKLEGVDRDWVDLGNRRRVSYTDLDDGEYLLRVKAANSEGVWNEAGFEIPVKVGAAPWDTWWAYLGYLALLGLIGGAVWLAQKRRAQREEAYTRRLEREVGERTEKLMEKNKQLHFLNRALQETSLTDPLTGLRNRRFVFEEVSRDLEVIRRKLEAEDDGVDTSNRAELVFMMIDLDNFKPINDTYGHAAGDEMLLEFRDVLLGICRRSEFVVRWGGDEFVVIAKQAGKVESEALAERIRSTVANHNFSLGDGQIVRTTCSIGFSAYPLFRGQADEADLDQCISLADGLMYEAKKKRNAWVGMMTPSEAGTSFDFDHESIEPTSLLFRARRAGKLTRYEPRCDEQLALPNLKRQA